MSTGFEEVAWGTAGPDEDPTLRAAKQRMLRDVNWAALEQHVHQDDPAVLLPVARVLAMDAREAFVALGSTTRGLSEPLTGWLEQKAVKVLRTIQTTVRGSDASVAQIAVSLLPDGRPSTSAVSPSQPPARAGDNAVSVVEDASGKGNGCLRLARPVAAFGEVVRVPAASLFNLDTLRRYSQLGSVLHRAQWRKRLDDDGEALLLACLVYERALGDKSHWRDFFRTCPTSFPTVPTNWSDEELTKMAGLSILTDVEAKRAAMAAFVETLGAVLVEVARVHTPVFVAATVAEEGTVEERVARLFNSTSLQWARCVFDSRAFHLNYRAASTAAQDRVLLTLAPTVDMINHCVNGTHILTRRITTEGDLVFEAGVELTEALVGTELVMSYGPLQTWELILSYGFAPNSSPCNENDRLPFASLSDLVTLDGPLDAPPLEGPPGDDPATLAFYDAWKRRIIKAHCLDVVEDLFIPASGVAPPVVRALLRLCQAEAAEFPALEADPFAAGPEYLEQCVSSTLANYASSFLQSVDPPSDDDDNDDGGDGDEAKTQRLLRRRMASTLRSSLLRIAALLFAAEGGDTEADDNDDD